MDNRKTTRVDGEDRVLREKLASYEEDLEEKVEREEWERTVAEAMWTERGRTEKDSG